MRPRFEYTAQPSPKPPRFIGCDEVLDELLDREEPAPTELDDDEMYDRYPHHDQELHEP